MGTQGLAVAAAEAPTPHGAWLLAQDRATRDRGGSDERGGSAGDAPRRHGAAIVPDDPAHRTGPARPTTFAQALDALSIAHLDHGRHLLRRLDGIGCTTLSDLRRLPAKGLARRFGPALVDELARASGDQPDPQTVFEAPNRFQTRVELMARVENAEALVFAAVRLLEQLAGWLAARRAAVRGFALVLHHERWSRDAIEPTTIPIALATPTRDLDRLVTLARERLSRLELKAPVLELALEAPVIVAEEEAPGRLFAPRDQTTETLALLLEKLVARLGHDALARIERVADHRPERAWRTLRGDLLDTRTGASRVDRTTASVAPCGPPWGPACGPRPAWLLTEPQALDVRRHRPCFESLPLDLVAGPERIEAGWWDDAPATRDYFIAENAAGHLVWIYRERLAADGGPQWYLQGLFA